MEASIYYFKFKFRGIAVIPEMDVINYVSSDKFGNLTSSY